MGLGMSEARVGCWRLRGMEPVYQRTQRPVGALEKVISLKSCGRGSAE